MSDTRPIGIFDSGIGGLTVLQEIRALLPHEDLLYLADSAYAPYGQRAPGEIRERALHMVDLLVAHDIKLLVVACNTATAMAAVAIRAHCSCPVVALEPAIKPALAQTVSGVIGVLATQRTLEGAAFADLVRRCAGHATVLCQPCPGLVELIETGNLVTPELHALLQFYVQPLIRQGADVIVLGCTHYPWVRAQIQQISGERVRLLDSGAAVARQVRRLLTQASALHVGDREGSVTCMTTGSATAWSGVLQHMGFTIGGVRQVA